MLNSEIRDSPYVILPSYLRFLATMRSIREDYRVGILRISGIPNVRNSCISVLEFRISGIPNSRNPEYQEFLNFGSGIPNVRNPEYQESRILGIPNLGISNFELRLFAITNFTNYDYEFLELLNISGFTNFEIRMRYRLPILLLKIHRHYRRGHHELTAASTQRLRALLLQSTAQIWPVTACYS